MLLESGISLIIGILNVFFAKDIDDYIPDDGKIKKVQIKRLKFLYCTKDSDKVSWIGIVLITISVILVLITITSIAILSILKLYNINDIINSIVEMICVCSARLENLVCLISIILYAIFRNRYRANGGWK